MKPSKVVTKFYGIPYLCNSFHYNCLLLNMVLEDWTFAFCCLFIIAVILIIFFPILDFLDIFYVFFEFYSSIFWQSLFRFSKCVQFYFSRWWIFQDGIDRIIVLRLAKGIPHHCSSFNQICKRDKLNPPSLINFNLLSFTYLNV